VRVTPVYRLGPDVVFPPPSDAHPSGLLAVGGDLRPERLLLAYTMGIFPWYEEGQPILWHSPDPRFVLLPEKLHVPRSLERKVLRRERFAFTLDAAFERVIRACAAARRREGPGTWITPAMIEAYVRLHELGFAHSLEAWQDERLVGGVYGVSLGALFSAESMFTAVPDAGKAALVTLVRWLGAHGCALVDCQAWTANLERFGAEEWPRERYLVALAEALRAPTKRGRWSLV
jgi:leucyl/phenylalanyl-tRNA--protein transferase